MGVGVFTLVTLIFYIFLIGEKSKLIGQIEANYRKIDSFKAREELIFVTKGKAKSATKILSTRMDHPGFFGKFEKLVPLGIYFTDIRFSQDKIIFAGKAKSSADIAGFVSALVSARGLELVSNVTVDSLNSDERGAYVFNISSQSATK